MKRISKNISAQIGQMLVVKWGVSKGVETYGWTTCSASYKGTAIAHCNGGGYDMRGTVVGDWMTKVFKPDLLKLREADMPQNSHWQTEDRRFCVGRCFRQYKAQKMFEVMPASLNMPKLKGDCVECPVCKGETVASREGDWVIEGRSFYGLLFLQPKSGGASKFPTRRHRIPSFDGACGFSQVERVLAALGVRLRRLDQHTGLRGPELYEVVRWLD